MPVYIEVHAGIGRVVEISRQVATCHLCMSQNVVDKTQCIHGAHASVGFAWEMDTMSIDRVKADKVSLGDQPVKS